MKNTVLRRFDILSSEVHSKYGEYVHDGTGKIVGGKAPNHKKIRDFYKKRDKFLRLRGKKY